MAKPVRIQKALTDQGILSRRRTEEYIREGRITVNGHKAQLGHPVYPTDVIAIDGVRVAPAGKKENLYIMLNKPRGWVTTTSDELGRRCVTQLLEDLDARVYPVGRLDKDSEGLLLLTNDGAFANLMMHPSHRVGKTYRVTVRPGVTEDQCIALSAGVDIGEEGKPEITAPASVLVLEKYPDRSVLQITITQGKNRQVRRMCQAVGLEVARLKRTAVGPLRLGMLQPGKWRELRKTEVAALRNAARPAREQEPIPQDVPGEHLGSFGKEGRRAPKKSAARGHGEAGEGFRRDRTGALRFGQEGKASGSPRPGHRETTGRGASGKGKGPREGKAFREGKSPRDRKDVRGAARPAAGPGKGTGPAQEARKGRSPRERKG
jgi:23S rRNA pseudouridine2605 synthase